MFESKKEDINLFKNLLQNGEDVFLEKYSQDLIQAQKMNIRSSIINLFVDRNKPVSEAEIQEQAKKWEIVEKMIKEKKN